MSHGSWTLRILTRLFPARIMASAATALNYCAPTVPYIGIVVSPRLGFIPCLMALTNSGATTGGEKSGPTDHPAQVDQTQVDITTYDLRFERDRTEVPEGNDTSCQSRKVRPVSCYIEAPSGTH